MNNFSFYRELFYSYERMMPFAIRLTANNEDAKDLVQDTMLTALIHKDKYSENNFKGWILTIMRNIFLNNYCKHQNRKNGLEEYEHLMSLQYQDEIQYDYVENDRIIVDAISEIKKLSKGEQLVFMMFISGYKYIEISHKTNIPLGTVKSRIYFIRKKLRLKLKEYIE